MTNSPKQIKPIIAQLMESPKFKKRWTEYLIQSKWEDWVGKRMAQHISPKNLKNGLLIVIIDDDKWVNPFDEFKDKILDKMKKDLSFLSIKGFTIITNPKRPNQKREKKGVKEKVQDKDNLKIQSSEPNQPLDKEMETTLSCIKDPVIRDALRRLIIKSLSSNQK